MAAEKPTARSFRGKGPTLAPPGSGDRPLHLSSDNYPGSPGVVCRGSSVEPNTKASPVLERPSSPSRSARCNR